MEAERIAADAARLMPFSRTKALPGKRGAHQAWILASHARLFAKHGVGGREAELLLSYEVERETLQNDRMVAIGLGHAAGAAHPERHTCHAVEYLDSPWIARLAERLLGADRVIAEGGDPWAPRARHTIADPCLARLLHAHGVDADTFLQSIPALGEMVVGANWRGGGVECAVVEANGIKIHLERNIGRIRVLRVALDGRGYYDPPEPRRSRLVGLVSLRRAALPQTVMTALIGRPLVDLVDHPALDPTLIIRTIARSGTGVLIRVDGAMAPARMK